MICLLPRPPRFILRPTGRDLLPRHARRHHSHPMLDAGPTGHLWASLRLSTSSSCPHRQPASLWKRRRPTTCNLQANRHMLQTSRHHKPSRPCSRVLRSDRPSARSRNPSSSWNPTHLNRAFRAVRPASILITRDRAPKTLDVKRRLAERRRRGRGRRRLRPTRRLCHRSLRSLRPHRSNPVLISLGPGCRPLCVRVRCRLPC